MWSPMAVSLSLDISETALRIFQIFCMKLVHHKGTKVTARFWKKILGGSKMGETPIFGAFYVFCPYLCIQSLKNSTYSTLWSETNTYLLTQTCFISCFILIYCFLIGSILFLFEDFSLIIFSCEYIVCRAPFLLDAFHKIK